MKPSSPVSDTSKTAPRPGLSKKAKFWIGLSLAVIIPVIAGFLAYRVYLALFPSNPRLVLNRVVLASRSGYWNPADENELQERTDSICRILRLEPGKTQLFSNKEEYGLAAMAAKLRQEIPELERADVRRVLPDELVFELHERIPVANLGTNYYIGDDGFVLSKTVYKETSLPMLSCSPAAVRVTGDGTAFVRGECLSGSAIRTALDFIRLVRLRYTDIHLLSIYIAKETDHIQCELLYKNDPGSFTVLIPLQTRASEKQLRDDVFGRLIPKLEESVRNHEEERALDLRFKDRVIAKKRN